MSDEEKNNESGSKKKSGLSLPIIIAIIAGGVIILVVTIIFVMNIMLNNMKESLIQNGGKVVEKSAEDEEKKEKESKNKSLDKYEYLETGRITTNPLQSTQYVVLNLGLFYEAAKKKESDESEETKSDPETKTKRLSALIRHQINSQIGDMDIFALQVPRDSLVIRFKERLGTSFKSEGLILKDVILLEFIIQ